MTNQTPNQGGGNPRENQDPTRKTHQPGSPGFDETGGKDRDKGTDRRPNVDSDKRDKNVDRGPANR